MPGLSYLAGFAVSRSCLCHGYPDLLLSLVRFLFSHPSNEDDNYLHVALLWGLTESMHDKAGASSVVGVKPELWPSFSCRKGWFGKVTAEIYMSRALVFIVIVFLNKFNFGLCIQLFKSCKDCTNNFHILPTKFLSLTSSMPVTYLSKPRKWHLDCTKNDTVAGLQMSVVFPLPCLF